MKVLVNFGKQAQYKGYLNPKAILPRESILYHIGSLFFSLMVFIILYLLETDPIMASACSVAFAIVLFVSLFKFNNSLFSKDRLLLDKLIVSKKLDSVDLLSMFFRDLRKAFETEGLLYHGVNDISDRKQWPLIQELLERIFREEGEHLYHHFRMHSGNFFRFIEILSPFQREILYRHYLAIEE